MKFTKLHGLGNDYVYVNTFEEHVDNPSSLARAVSDRHTGVGSDGLILIHPSRRAEVGMRIYNADGSRAQMCGNGIRCVAKYAVEHGVVKGPSLRIETDVGIKLAECHLVDGVVRSVRIDMGQPSLDAASLPSTLPVDRIINYPLGLEPRASARANVQTRTEPRASARANRQTRTEPRASARANGLRKGSSDQGYELVITCVSMGNPHAVVFVDDLDTIALEALGPRIEHASGFPERINAQFVRVDSAAHVTMKTWERGSGATRACGTGACAVCVAGVVTERTTRKITATLPGGDLEVEWANDDHVYMTGPAVEVFSGEWPG